MAGKGQIERVCRLVRNVCGTESHGGRCFVVSDTTCVLSDYEEWNGEMHDKVKDTFPSVDIVCAHNPRSATSFSVVFSLAEGSSPLLRALASLGLAALWASAAWQALVPSLCRCGCGDLQGNLLCA
eukprot:148272-Hanusia_phi.AAC.6